MAVKKLQGYFKSRHICQALEVNICFFFLYESSFIPQTFFKQTTTTWKNSYFNFSGLCVIYIPKITSIETEMPVICSQKQQHSGQDCLKLNCFFSLNIFSHLKRLLPPSWCNSNKSLYQSSGLLLLWQDQKQHTSCKNVSTWHAKLF